MPDIFDRTTAQRAGDRVQLVKNALNTVKNLCDPADPEVICVQEYVAANPGLVDKFNAILLVRNIIVRPATDVAAKTAAGNDIKGLGL